MNRTKRRVLKLRVRIVSSISSKPKLTMTHIKYDNFKLVRV